jgi:hypothetical protein
MCHLKCFFLSMLMMLLLHMSYILVCVNWIGTDSNIFYFAMLMMLLLHMSYILVCVNWIGTDSNIFYFAY